MITQLQLASSTDMKTMSTPLLSSLCRICHLNTPKYCCPRCSQQTCSLACSKRHKLWADCNGIRDPTAYKPVKELATPAGIDHDYNFISSIERGITRSDGRIVNERHLLRVKDLFQPPRPSHHYYDGSDRLSQAFQRSGVRVRKAPTGMQRQVDNGTRWDRVFHCLNWQVEWQRDTGDRVMGKVLETIQIGKAYVLLMQEEIVAKMTKGEKRQYMKRKAEDSEKSRASTKKIRVEESFQVFNQLASFQNHTSSAWDCVAPDPQIEIEITEEEDKTDQADIDTFNIPPSAYNSWELFSGVYFYLQRPNIPASCPRIVTPLHPTWSLKSILRNRHVQEFPTIYALSSSPNSLPEDFMLECHYLAAQYNSVVDIDSDDDSGKSNSDSDMEEGEIE